MSKRSGCWELYNFFTLSDIKNLILNRKFEILNIQEFSLRVPKKEFKKLKKELDDLMLISSLFGYENYIEVNHTVLRLILEKKNNPIIIIDFAVFYKELIADIVIKFRPMSKLKRIKVKFGELEIESNKDFFKLIEVIKNKI